MTTRPKINLEISGHELVQELDLYQPLQVSVVILKEPRKCSVELGLLDIVI